MQYYSLNPVALSDAPTKVPASAIRRENVPDPDYEAPKDPGVQAFNTVAHEATRSGAKGSALSCNNGTDHQVAAVISPLAKHTVRRLWCIRLFVSIFISGTYQREGLDRVQTPHLQTESVEASPVQAAVCQLQVELLAV